MAQIRSRASITARRITAGAVSLGVVLAGMAALPAAASAATPAVASGDVIVVLHNQHTDLAIAKGNRASARIQANHASQASLIAQARSGGAGRIHGSARSTPSPLGSRARRRPSSRPIPTLPLCSRTCRSRQRRSPRRPRRQPASRSHSRKTDQSVRPIRHSHCSSRRRCRLTNTAFSDPTTPQAQNIVDGTGVKVGFIADGLDINNPDFIRPTAPTSSSTTRTSPATASTRRPARPRRSATRARSRRQGRQVYDLSNFVNAAHPLPPGCNITIRGVAPGASLIGLKVFGNSNTAPTSRFIEAIDYAVDATAPTCSTSRSAATRSPTPARPDHAGRRRGGRRGRDGRRQHRRRRHRPARSARPASGPNGSSASARRRTFRSYIQDDVRGRPAIQRHLDQQQHLRPQLGRGHPGRRGARPGRSR